MAVMSQRGSTSLNIAPIEWIAMILSSDIGKGMLKHAKMLK